MSLRPKQVTHIDQVGLDFSHLRHSADMPVFPS